MPDYVERHSESLREGNTERVKLRLQGQPENKQAGQEALLKRAKANSDAQKGQYDPSTESSEAGERTFEKGYVY